MSRQFFGFMLAEGVVLHVARRFVIGVEDFGETKGCKVYVQGISNVIEVNDDMTRQNLLHWIEGGSIPPSAIKRERRKWPVPDHQRAGTDL